MRKNNPFEYDENPKENLEVLTKIFIFIVIVILGLSGLSFLAILLYKPIINILSIIGNIIIDAIDYITPIPFVILILLIAAAITKIGTFLEDKNDIKLYESLVEGFWFADIFTLFTLGLSIALNIISMSISAFAGIGFTLFIVPPFAFLIMKGLCKLLGLIIADACHNPFNG